MSLEALCGLRADHDGVVETRWVCNYGQMGCRPSPMSSPGEACARRYWTRSAAWYPVGTARPQGRSRQPPAPVVGQTGADRNPRSDSDAGGTEWHVMKVRFHLHRATLFGFQIGEETSFPGQE